jgi:hypothetical protein
MQMRALKGNDEQLSALVVFYRNFKTHAFVGFVLQQLRYQTGRVVPGIRFGRQLHAPIIGHEKLRTSNNEEKSSHCKIP